MNRFQLMPEERLILGVYLKSRKVDFALTSSLSAKEFLDKMTEFLYVYDKWQSVRYCDVFVTLYLSEKNILVQTADKIASQHYIQERTLLRYRNRFCTLIECFSKKLNVVYVLTDKDLKRLL